MYAHTPPRRPWRDSACCHWYPDKMVTPDNFAGIYAAGNCHVTRRKARVKQRRLDRFLCDPVRWDER